MIAIACVLMYLAIVKGSEPMLLLPIAFGMALANLPGSGVFHADYFTQETIDYGLVLHEGGLLDLLYLGVKLGIYPPLIFLGIGAIDGFRSAYRKPQEHSFGRGGSDWRFRNVFRCKYFRIYD